MYSSLTLGIPQVASEGKETGELAAGKDS
jgi:hypothetical protein